MLDELGIVEKLRTPIEVFTANETSSLFVKERIGATFYYNNASGCLMSLSLSLILVKI